MWAFAGQARAQNSPDEVDREPERAWLTPSSAGALAAAVVTFRSGLVLQESPAIAPPVTIGWRRGRGVLLDEPMRDLLVAGPAGQEIAAMISDVTLFATIGMALVLDAGLVPLVRGDPDLAWQAELAWAFANGITQSIGEIVKRATARDRPYTRRCTDDPQDDGCTNDDSARSFFSMHAGSAFTAAGVSCALHLERNLYGDVAADIASCGTSLALAGATALLRIVADRHYLSDVLVGSLLGFAVGYLTTIAIVPGRDASGRVSSDTAPRFAITPMIGSAALTGEGPSVDGVLGVTAFGTF